MPLTPSEALVERLCSKTFFRLWSVANPLRRPGKELCDLIVVCDPDILVWSVKDIAYKDTGSQVGYERWQREAIDASLKQLRGARRNLATMTAISSPTALAPIPLPPVGRRRIHMIAVALGSKREVPISEPNAGEDHFHVLEESGLEALLTELDTVTDFVDYLTKKQEYLKATQVIQTGDEHDLLALFLHRGREFPSEADLLVVTEGMWDELVAKPEWPRRKKADAVSYVWDRLIESFVNDFATRPPDEPQDFASLDAVLRTMARESRFARRMLGEALSGFYALAAAGKVRARQTVAPSGVVYVFLACERDVDRKHRIAELTARCWVARGTHLSATTVVGIATEQDQGTPGFSFDAVQLFKPGWDEEDERQRQYLQQELGFFRSPQWSRTHVEEFPDSTSDSGSTPSGDS